MWCQPYGHYYMVANIQRFAFGESKPNTKYSPAGKGHGFRRPCFGDSDEAIAQARSRRLDFEAVRIAGWKRIGRPRTSRASLRRVQHPSGKVEFYRAALAAGLDPCRTTSHPRRTRVARPQAAIRSR